jgi:RNA polymerase sigma-70 factor (ECF subfamily)
VNRYRDAACGVAYHYLGGFDDAQDAVQEAFVHAYLRLNQLSDPGKFAPWLRRITANACADLLRQRGDRLVSLDEEEARAMSDSEQDPERLAARRVVRQALERLPEKTRLAVTLFYIDGYSQEEVAGFLEVPVNTVRSRLRRAKQQLREEMMDMVTDVLTEGKPDPQFTKQVVDEALRRAWYAPGVGLVQLHVKQAEGTEAMIQLREFSVQGGGDDYLPLAVDNSWTYGWADVPPEYVAKEVYRVAANEGDRWYLENWRYCMRVK